MLRFKGLYNLVYHRLYIDVNEEKDRCLDRNHLFLFAFCGKGKYYLVLDRDEECYGNVNIGGLRGIGLSNIWSRIRSIGPYSSKILYSSPIFTYIILKSLPFIELF